MGKKYVYYFGDGKAEGTSHMKELLGGKGAGLAEMTNLGISVPPGFTISTEACVEYYRLGKKGWPRKPATIGSPRTAIGGLSPCSAASSWACRVSTLKRSSSTRRKRSG